MGVFEDYQKAVLDVEYNNCTLGELEAAEQRLKDSLIEWHPYPKVMPDEVDRLYLVTWESRDEVGMDYFTDDLYWDSLREVIAWAELPEPYKEGTD